MTLHRVMELIANLIIPLFLLLVLLFALRQRVNVWQEFLAGAREGFGEAVRLLPYLVTIYTAVTVFRVSGTLEITAKVLAPVLNFFGIPVEVLPVMLVRPLSGSASLALTAEVINRAGPDSFAGQLASCIYGSSETTLYVIAVYFAAVGIKKVRYSLMAGLLADLAGYAGAVYICYRLFAG